MALSSTQVHVDLVGLGSDTTFTIPFPFMLGTDLEVYVEGVLYSYGGAYTISGGLGSTGTITFSSPPVGAILIVRTTPLTQPAVLATQGPFFSSSIEGALDRTTMQTQELGKRTDEVETNLATEVTARQTDVSGLQTSVSRVYSENARAISDLAGSAHTSDSLSSVLAYGTLKPRTLTTRFADFVNVRDFGAVGDDTSHPLSDYYDTLAEAQVDYPHADSLTNEIDWAAIQAAVNHAIYTTKIGRVLIPDGSYLIDRTIHLGYGTDYRHVELEGMGRCYGGNRTLFGGTVIKASFSDRPAINIQGGRLTTIRGMTIRGANADYLTTQWADVPRNWKPDKSVWLDPALDAAADSRYAPYAAITIDAYSGVDSRVPNYPDVFYPAWLGAVSQYGKNYSGNFVIEQVQILGFVAGIVTHPNGSDGNGDFLTIKDSLINTIYGLSIGHSQSRNVNCINVRFDGCWQAITTTTHGAQIGQLGGVIHGCSFDSCYEAFEINTAYSGSFTVDSCYSELLTRIGTIHVNAAGNRPVKFAGCNFSFEIDDYGPIVNTHLDSSGSSRVIFDSCSLGTARGFAYVGDGVEFRGTASHIGGVGYWATAGLGINLSLNGSRGALPSFTSAVYRRRFPMSLKSKVNTNVDSGTSGGYGCDLDMDHTDPLIQVVGGATSHIRPFPFSPWDRARFGDEEIYNGLGIEFNRNGITFTRSGLDYSFDATSIRGTDAGTTKAAKLFGIGDIVVDLATETRFFVSNISGGTVTLTQLTGYEKNSGVYSPITGCDITINSNTNMVVHCTRLFHNAYAFIGDFTSGSAVITNIRRILDDFTPVTVSSTTHGWYAQEGDMLVSGTEINTLAKTRIVMSHLTSSTAAVIASGGLATPGQITMNKNAYRTAAEVPINFWVRKPA